jgi:hypothetical protein
MKIIRADAPTKLVSPASLVTDHPTDITLSLPVPQNFHF